MSMQRCLDHGMFEGDWCPECSIPVRRDGHSALRAKDGKLERFDPHPDTHGDKVDDELPGMLAVAKGVADQKFPHTMDAKTWAEEFCKVFHPVGKNPPYQAMNTAEAEGLMIGWFANAIMAGYDTAQARATRSAGTRILVRYCAGCGSIGEVPDTFRDCCPDGGSMSVQIPPKVAEQCRATFKAAISNAAPQDDRASGDAVDQQRRPTSATVVSAPAVAAPVARSASERTDGADK